MKNMIVDVNSLEFIRFGTFAFIFGLLLGLEQKYYWRKRASSLYSRLKLHLSLAALNSILIKLVFPGLLIGFAIQIEKEGMGLLRSVYISPTLSIILGVILMDLVMYVQHKMMHQVPLLWRLHRVHHIDRELDVTTGVRFHPLEMLFSMFFKMCGIALLGPPVISVIIFEIVLNAFSLFTHANININKKLDGLLRLVVVTPSMHRVHHSEVVSSQNSNFGFCISLWDRMFESYHYITERKLEDIIFGVVPYFQNEFSTMKGLLLVPFLDKPAKVRSKIEKIKIEEADLESSSISNQVHENSKDKEQVSSKIDKA